MGLLDTTIVRSNTKESTELIITNIDSLTSDEKEYIKKNLVEIAQGRDSVYRLKTIAKKLDSFFGKSTPNEKQGAIAELILVLILRNQGFSQEYCYRNLEEGGSVKKGFDGLFLKDKVMWLAECKSTSDSKHNKKHKHTIEKSYESITNLLAGKSSNDPWANAVNHSKNAGSKARLIEKLTKLSESYTNMEFQTVDDSNIVLGSAVINEDIKNIISDQKLIEPYLGKHKSQNELLVAVNLENVGVLQSFIKEVANGK